MGIPAGCTNASPRILYCHGGGYEFYSPQDVYRPCTSRLSAVAGMPLLCFDYRLAPEYRHPSPITDAVQAFQWLSDNGPEGPGRAPAIFICGDSAGGGLALSLALRLRDRPADARGMCVAGVSVVSPQTDCSCSGESYKSRIGIDPIFTGEDPSGESMPQVYMLLGQPQESNCCCPRDPTISPLHAELHGLPPTQIHVGDAEVMLSDSVEFGKKAKAAGSSVTVVVWPRMWHTFTQYTEGGGGDDAQPLQDALDALQQQGKFLRGLATGRRGSADMLEYWAALIRRLGCPCMQG